jgi:hypothetical protein
MENWTGERPPRLPANEYELERAVMLLGSMGKGHRLKQSKREELEEFVGRLPRSAEEAQEWKRALKYWKKEMEW